jgi:20S proteasome alpha/beta subunit
VNKASFLISKSCNLAITMAWGTAATAVVAVAGVFWQSPKVLPTDRYDPELPLSSFGSHGRLFAVDATLSAVDRRSAASVVSLCCQDGVVTVSTTTQSPYIHAKELLAEPVGSEWLVAPSPPIARLDAATVDPPMAVVAGTGVDQVLLRSFVQEMAERYITAAGQNNSASVTARRLADALQLRTQQPSKGRVLVASCLLLDSQSIWKVDASGQFWKLHGGAIGRHAPRIEQYLLDTAQSRSKSASSSDSAEPNEWMARLTCTQAMALARDAILSAYQQQQSYATAKTSEGDDDNEKQQDRGKFRMRAFVLGRQGRRAFDHDALLTMSVNNDI